MKGSHQHNFFGDNQFDDLLARYERMIGQGEQYYFDVEDFEQIIEHYLDVNKTGKALNAVRYAFRLHPNAFPLMIKKAQIHLRNKNPQRALTTLREVRDIESSNNEYYLTMGHAYLLMNNLEDAEQCYYKALYLIDDKDERLDMLQNISQTLQFSEMHDYAIKYLRKAHQMEPKNLLILYDLAYCYEKTGKFQKGIDYYHKYLDIEPYTEHIWYSVGKLHSDAGQVKKAVEAYEMAVAINPEYADALFELAILQEDEGKYEQAIEAYTDYLRQEPESADVHYFLGNCYLQVHKDEQALEHFQKALKLESHNPGVYYGIARILFKQNNLWDALFYAKRATMLDDEDHELFILYGRINSRLRMYKESAKAFLKAVELKPEVLKYWIMFTDELIRNQKFEQALKYTLQSLELHDDSPLIHFRIAALYYKTDRLRYSIRYFRKGMLMNSDQYQEFFKICPEAKRSREIKKLLKNQII